MSDPIISQTLDQLLSALPTGSLDRAILNNLSRFNHRQTPGAVPSNKKSPGYIFFTRPQLNMQADNLRNTRKLSMLLSSVPESMQTYIRCMLDPRLMTGVKFGNGRPIPPINCPVVDNKQAFIPILTNSCINAGSWPSISLPTFSSKAGLYGESFTMADGRVLNSGEWDLSVTFKNTRGDPIMLLFYVWILYMSFAFEGVVAPYLDYMTEISLDCNTRIYRLVMDYKKDKITEIAACHAALPVGLPIGDVFAIPGDQTYSDANKEVSMTFKCTGVDYFDPIVAKEFNEVVAIFNPAMKDGIRQATMMPIPRSMIDQFNWNGYPYIDVSTAQLKWYVSMDNFSSRTGELLSEVQTYNADADFEGE